MPFREGDPRQKCYARTIALRNYFRKYASDSEFAKLSDNEIEKNIIDRYDLYVKAKQYSDINNKKRKVMKSRIKQGKNILFDRFPDSAFPLDDIEKQNKLVDAWNGDKIKPKLEIIKEFTDDILNTNVIDALTDIDNPDTCIEKTLKYQNVLKSGYVIIDFKNVLEKYQDEGYIDLPQNYIKSIEKAASCYQELNYVNSLTTIMGSEFNFLFSGKDKIPCLKDKDLVDVAIVSSKMKKAKEADQNMLSLFDKVPDCSEKEFNEWKNFIKNAKEKKISGKMIDYKMPNNAKEHMFLHIANGGKINEKSDKEKEVGSELEVAHYKRLWNSTRCNIFNGFADEVRGTNRFNEKAIRKQLHRLATLSQVHKDHKAKLSGWDYITPWGWHRRNCYRKEENCLNNMMNALRTSGYPDSVIDKVKETSNLDCLTDDVMNRLQDYINEKRQNPLGNLADFDLNADDKKTKTDSNRNSMIIEGENEIDNMRQSYENDDVPLMTNQSIANSNKKFNRRIQNNSHKRGRIMGGE